MRTYEPDGRQYWILGPLRIRVPEWWLRTFGYGYHRGGLLRAFIIERHKKKVSREAFAHLDRKFMEVPHQFCRHPDETDAEFRQWFLRAAKSANSTTGDQ